jgi:hypothetical protein
MTLSSRSPKFGYLTGTRSDQVIGCNGEHGGRELVLIELIRSTHVGEHQSLFVSDDHVEDQALHDLADRHTNRIGSILGGLRPLGK